MVLQSPQGRIDVPGGSTAVELPDCHLWWLLPTAGPPTLSPSQSAAGSRAISGPGHSRTGPSRTVPRDSISKAANFFAPSLRSIPMPSEWSKRDAQVRCSSPLGTPQQSGLPIKPLPTKQTGSGFLDAERQEVAMQASTGETPSPARQSHARQAVQRSNPHSAEISPLRINPPLEHPLSIGGRRSNPGHSTVNSHGAVIQP